jgi:TldD protein
MTDLLKPYQDYLHHGDFSDIYLEDSSSLSLRWEEGRIETLSSADESGAGVRILNGLETRFAHTDLSNPLTGSTSGNEKEKLDQVMTSITPGMPAATPAAPRSPILKAHAIKINPASVDMKDKIKLLQRAFDAANTGPHIRQVNINYGEKAKRIGYLNSLGESFLEERAYVVFSITVTVEKAGDLQTAYESFGGIGGLEWLEPARIERLARLASERAHKKLYAPQAPVGPMPVIIASSSGGTLIHEAVGHSLEADLVLDGSSPAYLGKIGTVVAHPKLTVFDNPTVVGARGSFHFDDEGTPSEASRLIDKGVLKDFMFDRLSARKAGRKSNGHGRRESYAHRPIPRMSNTYVAPGPDDPKEIIRNFKEGLIVTRMGGGQVNTANGDFVFEVEEGFHVKNGKTTLVRGATLLGNGPEVLKVIDQVGTDHGWAIGTCGKEGQGVPVSDAIPTIHIQKLVVGGSK